MASHTMHHDSVHERNKRRVGRAYDNMGGGGGGGSSQRPNYGHGGTPHDYRNHVPPYDSPRHVSAGVAGVTGANGNILPGNVTNQGVGAIHHQSGYGAPSYSQSMDVYPSHHVSTHRNSYNDYPSPHHAYRPSKTHYQTHDINNQRYYANRGGLSLSLSHFLTFLNFGCVFQKSFFFLFFFVLFQFFFETVHCKV